VFIVFNRSGRLRVILATFSVFSRIKVSKLKFLSLFFFTLSGCFTLSGWFKKIFQTLLM
jgi:hypothetical protein